MISYVALCRILMVAFALTVALGTGCRSVSPGPHTTESPVPHEHEPHRLASRPEAETETHDLPPGPLRVSLEEAVLMALHNNQALRVQELQPVVMGTFEQLERGVFDPLLFGEVTQARERTQRFPEELEVPINDLREQRRAEVGLVKTWALGTQLEAVLTHTVDESDRVPETQHAFRAGVSITQSLLQGAGRTVNLVQLERARLDTVASRFELRGYAEALLADVETTYWEYVLARRELTVFEESLSLAEQQREAVESRIELGRLAAVELSAAEAEVALRRQALIDARSRVETLRVRLLRLLNPDRLDWDRAVEPVDVPAAAALQPDPLSEHVAVAPLWRPDLYEAQVQMESRELEVVRTRNGLLPRLDFFIALGQTGFAESFDQSIREIDGDNYDALIGLRTDYAWGNRRQRSSHRLAQTTRQQAEESVRNLRQLIEMDVRIAYTEVQRSREQMAATAITQRLQADVLRTETERFERGLSTVLDLAQIQRDFLEAQIADVGAAIAYRQALIELYRVEGTLLARRGITGFIEERLPGWN